MLGLNASLALEVLRRCLVDELLLVHFLELSSINVTEYAMLIVSRTRRDINDKSLDH